MKKITKSIICLVLAICMLAPTTALATHTTSECAVSCTGIAMNMNCNVS